MKCCIMIKSKKNKPTITNIGFHNHKGEWITRTFFPFYDDQLLWAENVKCPDSCKLACRCHPMVQDEHNENMWHKLCTLSVIKAKIMTESEILKW